MTRTAARSLLPASALALVLAACGGGQKSPSAGGSAGDGGVGAPAVGNGGNVNGNGMTDSNATIPAAKSATGEPNSAGLGTDTVRRDSAGIGGGAARP